MKRVLFVDDEPRVLEGIENLLFSSTDNWYMRAVNNGEEALLQLEQHQFDIVVTDMQMPGMDGSALLHRVKDRHPNVVRIVLSGSSELDSVLSVMPIAHQVLSKPCNPRVLINVLNRACQLHTLINDTAVQSLLGRVDALPARPRIYSEITQLLISEEASLDDVASIVTQDIGISTKILQVANTAFFSRGNVTTSVQQAVLKLGVGVVNNLVLAAEVFRDLGAKDFTGFCIDRLHDHSLLAAGIAGRLIDNRKQSEDAFLAAMLHDVGKIILATMLPEHFAAALNESAQTGRPLYLVEGDIAHASHAEIGAYILGLWGLPYPIIEAVAFHHQPQRVESDSFDLVAAVYVANALVHELETSAEDPSLDFDFLDRCGVADRIDDWREMAAKVSEDVE